MLRVGEVIDGWRVACIDYPVGAEAWAYPAGWQMVALTGPDDEFVILTLSPRDQTTEKTASLLRAELEARARWIKKTVNL